MLLHSGRLRRGEQLQLPRETENGLLGQRLNEREAGTGSQWEVDHQNQACAARYSQSGRAGARAGKEPGEEKGPREKCWEKHKSNFIIFGWVLAESSVLFVQLF